jgi:hypothetical protein
MVAIKCRLVDKAGPKQPGDMWFDSELAKPKWADFLSLEYERDWRGKRNPVNVMLPNKAVWCVDQHATDDDKPTTRHGWTVTGEPPNLTANPSIIAGDYHGWLRNGELTN